MTRKKIVALSILVVLAGAVVAIHQSVVAGNHGPHYRLEGTWVGGSSDLGTVITATFVPSSPANNRVSFAGDLAQADLTLGGWFPEVSNEQNMAIRGDAVRTGPRTFDISGIFYARDADRQIVLILVAKGSLTLTDANTYEESVIDSVFLAQQDADGDGFPDPGEEPLFAFPVENTFKRLSSVLQ